MTEYKWVIELSSYIIIICDNVYAGNGKKQKRRLTMLGMNGGNKYPFA